MNATHRTKRQTAGYMTKDQFTADFIRVLRSGAKIAAGKEKTAGEARDMINKLRAEIEADKREGR